MTVKRVMLMVEWQVGQLVHGVVDYARTRNWHLILWHAGDVRKALREWRGDGVIAGVLYPDLFARKTVSGVDWKLVSLVPLKGPTLPYTLVREDDAAACDALEVLRMACVNGAHAMRLPDCDGLEPGKQADLVLLDLHQPNMQPENHILKNVVYRGSKQNVRLTMVAGKILYEDGVFYTGCDPERVYAEANAIIRRMTGSLSF